ncbi:MAG: NAD(P)/FAD-dependent oxidoreductase [Candidatus ainarchaeum sp.]|nr:NAD(P)/FAD-dependent oxidoreductase [Candidatus ainarchaeum sp.]
MRTKRDLPIAVLGAGFTGLSAAHSLAKKGFKVLVFEKKGEAGGLSSCYRVNGYSIERFYHHLSGSDATTRGLMRELGLLSRLEWRKASTAYLLGKRAYKMDSVVEIGRFPGLGLLDKMRLGMTVLQSRFLDQDVEKLDKTSAEAWVKGSLGERAYENFFEPLLRSKYGENAGKVSAAWLMGRIRFRSHRGLGGEGLGYPRNSYSEIISRLVLEAQRNGAEFRFGEEAAAISGEPPELRIETPEGEFRASAAISTLPPQAVVSLAKPGKNVAKLLESIRYQGVLCMLLSLKRPLLKDGTYWLNIKSGDSPLGAVIEHTNFQTPAGMKAAEHLLYVPLYVQNWQREAERKTDAEIAELMLGELRKILPFSGSDVNWWRMAREKHAAPIYEVGYLEKLNSVPGSVRGIHLAGMMRSFPERSVEDSIRQGLQAAEKVSRGGEDGGAHGPA